MISGSYLIIGQNGNITLLGMNFPATSSKSTKEGLLLGMQGVIENSIILPVEVI